MNDQLWKYLDRTDRENARLAKFIYGVNLMVNILAFLTCLHIHFGPGFIMHLNDIHAVMAVMYMAINFLLIVQIRRNKDERKRMYLLPTYSLLIGLDTIAEQFITVFIHRDDVVYGLLNRSNVLFVVTATFTMAIYINRYISLKRKYSMLPTGKDVKSWTNGCR